MTAARVDPREGNSARFAARPLPGGGTPTCVWLGARRQLPELDLVDCPEIVLVAAHPDDETFGFGATSTMLAGMGVRVQVVSASDGGASHPGLSSVERSRLEHVRRAELHRAVSALGLREPRLSAYEIGEHENRLSDVLSEILAARPSGTWCAATWRGDGHPDHEAVGRAAAVAVGPQQRSWWVPGVDVALGVPGRRRGAVGPRLRVPLTREAIDRKYFAAQSFHSQFEPMTADAPPAIPPAVLRRLLAVGEVVFR
jgi:LmbE family N-acetylglucosaminyl deacetylase